MMFPSHLQELILTFSIQDEENNSASWSFSNWIYTVPNTNMISRSAPILRRAVPLKDIQLTLR